jgi:hypothetical protein
MPHTIMASALGVVLHLRCSTSESSIHFPHPRSDASSRRQVSADDGRHGYLANSVSCGIHESKT